MRPKNRAVIIFAQELSNMRTKNWINFCFLFKGAFFVLTFGQ
jgi:hypothetical protein